MTTFEGLHTLSLLKNIIHGLGVRVMKAKLVVGAVLTSVIITLAMNKIPWSSWGELYINQWEAQQATMRVCSNERGYACIMRVVSRGLS